MLGMMISCLPFSAGRVERWVVVAVICQRNGVRMLSDLRAHTHVVLARRHKGLSASR